MTVGIKMCCSFSIIFSSGFADDCKGIGILNTREVQTLNYSNWNCSMNKKSRLKRNPFYLLIKKWSACYEESECECLNIFKEIVNIF